MMRLRSWLISAWKANVSASAISDLYENETKVGDRERERTEKERLGFSERGNGAPNKKWVVI